MAKYPQYPYADKYTVLRGLPSEGRDDVEIIDELT